MASLSKVINYFVKKSPVGEVHEVLGDVAKIVGHEPLTHEKVKEAIRSHLEEHKSHVKLPDGRLAMINSSERQSNTAEGKFVYFDRKLDVKFQFDALDMGPGKVTVCADQTDENPPPLDEAWMGYRNEVTLAVEEYIARKFKPGTTRSNVFFEDGKLRIEISCINLNFSSFWGGEWQAVWICDTQMNTIQGVIHVNNHYFESGNIQVNLEKKTDEIPIADATGANIVKAIEKFETSYQQNLDDMHENFKDGIFKRIRRIKPVHGQDFDWTGTKKMT